MNILITGANGFIGHNLSEWLASRDNCNVLTHLRMDGASKLDEKLAKADIIFHLAGVNRPQHEEEFEVGNVQLTEQICDSLTKLKRATPIIFSSSTQAALENPYGTSKSSAENALRNYADNNDARVSIYRLPGVFGKWSRPNYNTVVATFCHNIARDLPIQISDPHHELSLVYIDDVMQHFIAELDQTQKTGVDMPAIAPVHKISLGALAEQIRSFRQGRETVYAPGFDKPFAHKLYATFLSFLDDKDLSYRLQKRTDPRGSLAEFIKLPSFGQIFVSRTAPGITRGNHYHHTKTEKFLVLEGEAAIRFRHLLTDEVIEYRVRGEDYEVVDIPPGYTHSIENIGTDELVTLFWASEVFDPESPDTYYTPVLESSKD